MEMAGIFTLEADGWLLKIDAVRGGQVVECRWQGQEVCTTAKVGLWPSDSQAGCFPLVPYSNRIRNGAFNIAGRSVSLTAPEFAYPHALHGLGWHSAWSCQQAGANEATLFQTHDGAAWPWPYRARQHFSARGNRLTMSLEIENSGATAMPTGIGFHPYFPRTPNMKLDLRVGGFWTTSASDPGIPQSWCPLDPLTNFFDGKDLDTIDLDHCFTGWDRTARIEYPDTHLCVDLAASAAFSNLVIFCPKHREILCIEPVSHVNDAANLSELDPDQKMNQLEPGERLAGTMTINVTKLG